MSIARTKFRVLFSAMKITLQMTRLFGSKSYSLQHKNAVANTYFLNPSAMVVHQIDRAKIFA
jgi:hypothetical protein